MKVIGTRANEKVFEKGEFHCHGCHTIQNYIWYKVYRWLVLIFVNVFPYKLSGEYLECQECLKTFDPTVLNEAEDSNLSEQLAEFQKGIRDIMILIMLADGVIDPEEISSIQGLYTKMVGGEYSSESINRDIGKIQGLHKNIEDHPKKAMKKLAKRLSGFLNESGKLDVFHAAVTVAWADGVIQDQEQTMLNTLAREFELSSRVVEATMEESKKHHNYSSILKSFSEAEEILEAS
ncbi:MAG: TerB family tellurite resistance protein [SAR324 cluster bacterium]|nr:TerB family tellurite resistance protein [SAR324 cluster bacterium]